MYIILLHHPFIDSSHIIIILWLLFFQEFATIIRIILSDEIVIPFLSQISLQSYFNIHFLKSINSTIHNIKNSIIHLTTTNHSLILTFPHSIYPFQYKFTSNYLHFSTSFQSAIFCYDAGFNFYCKTQFWICDARDWFGVLLSSLLQF